MTTIQIGNYAAKKDMVFGWCILHSCSWVPIRQMRHVETLQKLKRSFAANPTVKAVAPEIETQIDVQLDFLKKSQNEEALMLNKMEQEQLKLSIGELQEQIKVNEARLKFAVALGEFAKLTSDYECLAEQLQGRFYENTLGEFTKTLKVSNGVLTATSKGDYAYAWYDLTTKKAGRHNNDEVENFRSAYDWAVRVMQRFW